MRTNLDRKEGLVGILRVLLVEPRKQLEVRRGRIRAVKLAWYDEHKANFGLYLDVPLFRSIFTPGGMASTPALMASKASSSGRGMLGSLHLERSSVSGVVNRSGYGVRHHHEAVLHS